MNINHDSRSSDQRLDKNEGAKTGGNQPPNDISFNKSSFDREDEIRKHIKKTEEAWKIAANEGRQEDKVKLRSEFEELHKALEKLQKGNRNISLNESPKQERSSDPTFSKSSRPRSKSLSESVKDLEDKCDLAFRDRRYEELLGLRKQLAQLQKELDPTNKTSAPAAKENLATAEPTSTAKPASLRSKILGRLKSLFSKREDEPQVTSPLHADCEKMLEKRLAAAKLKYHNSNDPSDQRKLNLALRQLDYFVTHGYEKPTSKSMRTTSKEVFAVGQELQEHEISMKFKFHSPIEICYWILGGEDYSKILGGGINFAAANLTFDKMGHDIVPGLYSRRYALGVYCDYERARRKEAPDAVAYFTIEGRFRHFEVAISGTSAKDLSVSITRYKLPKAKPHLVYSVPNVKRASNVERPAEDRSSGAGRDSSTYSPFGADTEFTRSVHAPGVPPGGFPASDANSVAGGTYTGSS